MQAGADEYFEGAARWLKAEKVNLGSGLSDSEIGVIEARYEFTFPADLRRFLQIALPLSAPESKRVWFYMTGDFVRFPKLHSSRRRQYPRVVPWSFPNWRAKRRSDVERLDALVNDPFDLAEHYLAQSVEKGLWDAEWGEKPDDSQEAIRQMSDHVRRAPKLIPVGSAFYIAAEPTEEGNPVWEYFIEDLQYYAGFDLPGFLHNRFGVPLPSWAALVPRWIDFWSEFLHHSPGRTSREAYDIFVQFLLEDRDPPAARERFFRGQPEPFIPAGDEPPEWADRYPSNPRDGEPEVST